MKKLLGVVTVILLIACVVIFYPRQTPQYIKVHIKANSFMTSDKQICSETKDIVEDYLSPLMKNSKDNSSPKDILTAHKNNIQNIVNSYLYSKNISYRCKVNIGTNKSENNDAGGSGETLIIELGKAQGQDNTLVFSIKK